MSYRWVQTPPFLGTLDQQQFSKKDNVRSTLTIGGNVNFLVTYQSFSFLHRPNSCTDWSTISSSSSGPICVFGYGSCSSYDSDSIGLDASRNNIFILWDNFLIFLLPIHRVCCRRLHDPIILVHLYSPNLEKFSSFNSGCSPLNQVCSLG